MFIHELSRMIEVAKKASEIILDIYHNGFHVETKDDDSPVTEADKKADELIREYLGKYFPTYSFLTEEHADNLSRLDNDLVFIVDPLDGTKDFVCYDDEFTINIALAYKHKIVASVVAVPVYGYIYYALKDYGAYKLNLKTNEARQIFVNNKTEDLTVLKSRYHSVKEEEEIFKKYSDKIKHVDVAGSAYKACLISEGKAEISYRLSTGTKEWDTAAFDLLVNEAGGYVLSLDKTPIEYNRRNVQNDYYIIVNNLKNWYFD